MFSKFQTESATLHKIVQGTYGEEIEASYNVNIDPVLGKKRIYTNENEEITGQSTTMTTDEGFDQHHDRFRLEFKGRYYVVRQIIPFSAIGSNEPDHFEIVLT